MNKEKNIESTHEMEYNGRKLSFQTTGLRANSSSPRNNIITLISIIVNCVTFVIMALFNAAASANIFSGLFKNVTSAISASSEVSITPAGWTFSTWGIIYAWQILWLLFNFILIFIRNNEGERFYNNPPVLTLLFHSFVFGNFIFNIIWLFLWDSKEFTAAFIFLFLMTAALYVALVISHRNIFNAEEELPSWLTWCYRILVNNGIAFYATWITVATNLNLAIAITYSWSSSADQTNLKSTSGIIGLAIIAVILVIYFILDIYVLEKYLRYTFSVYIQLAIALAGILSKNWNPNEPAAIFALVLIIIGPGIMFLTKIVSTVFRSLNR